LPTGAPTNRTEVLVHIDEIKTTWGGYLLQLHRGVPHRLRMSAPKPGRLRDRGRPYDLSGHASADTSCVRLLTWNPTSFTAVPQWLNGVDVVAGPNEAC
jgi:hypothetical protein